MMVVSTDRAFGSSARFAGLQLGLAKIVDRAEVVRMALGVGQTLQSGLRKDPVHLRCVAAAALRDCLVPRRSQSL